MGEGLSCMPAVSRTDQIEVRLGVRSVLLLGLGFKISMVTLCPFTMTLVFVGT